MAPQLGLDDVLLTDKVSSALAYAEKIHEGQYRKGTRVPYFTHLYRVAARVRRDGGNDNQVAAALLHDALEDQPGRTSEEAIRRLFGTEVLRIVKRATKPEHIDPDKRYELYLDGLRLALPDEQLIIIHDKIDNATDTLHDLLVLGHASLRKFKSPEKTINRFAIYEEIFEAYGYSQLKLEYSALVTAIMTETGYLNHR